MYSFSRIHRLFGLCGLAGALLFFAGDMLFYGHLGSGPDFHQGMLVTVIHASRERLFAGGLVGPFAACLCIVGFWHVYRNVRPSYIVLGRLMFALFAVLMVAGSAVHTLWTARGLAIKYCCWRWFFSARLIIRGGRCWPIPRFFCSFHHWLTACRPPSVPSSLEASPISQSPFSLLSQF